MNRLYFKKCDEGFKIFNRSHQDLGMLSYNHNWKKFIFEVFFDSFFDENCLKEIIVKLEDLNKK